MFKAGSARRRLAPIPHAWQTASSQRLEQMCRIAEPIDRREILKELVEAGQMLVTSVAAPAAGISFSGARAAIAAEDTLASFGVRDPAASRAYQRPNAYSRATFRA